MLSVGRSPHDGVLSTEAARSTLNAVVSGSHAGPSSFHDAQLISFLQRRAETGRSLRPQCKFRNLKKVDTQDCDPTFSMCKRRKSWQETDCVEKLSFWGVIDEIYRDTERPALCASRAISPESVRTWHFAEKLRHLNFGVF
ncbi:MAG: hypothetical protein ABJR46_02105 [Tateyamaria sp.]|uniref:hypothetical protein n=1 Tax=Tateyamaria sp. TaxID=1929288 RepID=UPI00329DC9A1